MATTTTFDGHSGTSAEQLVPAWVRLWNGDLDAAPSVLADNLKLHAARVDGATDDSGSEALTSWISVMRTVIPDIHFEVEVGPFVDGDVIVLRWIATGHHASGLPGATRPAGTQVRFTGTDILLVAHARVAEYWVNADMHVLLAQLGILPG
ncbi:MAG: ester cyclase [Janthinobacterium lividum]